MTAPPPKIRMTMTTRAVLDCLMAADPADQPWGYRIIEQTGLGPGTVYPILERLEQAGWITGEWETTEPNDRPRRRLYTMTGHGHQAFQSHSARRKWTGLSINPKGALD